MASINTELSSTSCIISLRSMGHIAYLSNKCSTGIMLNTFTVLSLLQCYKDISKCISIKAKTVDAEIFVGI